MKLISLLLLLLSPLAYAGDTGTANQVMRIPSGGGRGQYGSINIASSTVVGSSILPVANGGKGSAGAIATKATTYAVQSTDDTLLCNAAGGAFTFTMPTPSTVTGRVFKFKKIDSSVNACTLGPAAAETFDGGASTTLNTQYEETDLVSDGTNWYIQKHYIPSVWTSFTPTGSWVSNTTYTGYYRRVGDSIEVRVHVALTGAPTSTALTVNIPNSSSWTINTSKLYANLQAPLGDGKILRAASDNYGALVSYSTTTAVAVQYVASTAAIGPTDTPGVSQVAPVTFANLDWVEVKFAIPITGFSG
jgi:hypothetical protein